MSHDGTGLESFVAKQRMMQRAMWLHYSNIGSCMPSGDVPMPVPDPEMYQYAPGPSGKIRKKGPRYFDKNKRKRKNKIARRSRAQNRKS